MTNDTIEMQIRQALESTANDIDVPDGLAERTLAFAREQAPQPLWGRFNGWRDAQRMRARPSGYPRTLLTAGAAACALLLFGVGAFVTRPMDDAVDVAQSSSEALQPSRDERLLEMSGDSVKRRVDEDGSVVMDLPAQSGNAVSGDAVAGQVAGVVSSGDSSVDSTNRSADVDIETGNTDPGNDPSAFVGLTGGTEEQLAQTARGPFLDPKLVKAADIRVAVEDFDPAWDAANDVAAKYGGAVINSRTQQVSDRIAQGTVTMRVPSARLDAVLEELRNLGTLARLNTSGDDIAEQIDQNKQKIEDVRAEEAELLEMQRRAATVSEQLEVKRRLEDVRRSIESLKKKQKNYEDQVEFSAVSATIFEDDSVGDDGSVLARAFDTGISTALTILAGTLVILAALLPIAVLVIAVWFGVRALRRRRPGATE